MATLSTLTSSSSPSIQLERGGTASVSSPQLFFHKTFVGGNLICLEQAFSAKATITITGTASAFKHTTRSRAPPFKEGPRKKPEIKEARNVDYYVNANGLSKQERAKEALESLHLLYQQGMCANSNIYACLLHGCSDAKQMEMGKSIHASIIKTGVERDIFLGNNLATMYAKCGSIKDARRLFDQMPERNVISWTVMIAAYAQNGHGEKALKLFYHMQHAGVKPNNFTFSSAIRACATLEALEQGIEIHKLFQRSGCRSDVVIESALVDMYVKCGHIEEARQVFDKMSQRNVVTWTTMIVGYAQNERGEESLRLFCSMLGKGIRPNQFTFASVVGACTRSTARENSKQVHAHIIKNGFESHVSIGTSLVDTYAKSGNMVEACKVFDKMPERNVVSWTAMIAVCAQNEHSKEAFKLFHKMQLEGIKPNLYTITSILTACAGLVVLEQGKQVHSHIIKSGFELDIGVGSGLVDLYAKCGNMVDACKIFYGMSQRNVVSWTVMLAGYAWNGYCVKALELFYQMQLAGVMPDVVTITSVLSVCAQLEALQQGKDIHDYVIRNGFDSGVSVGNALMDMYAKCQSMETVQQVFDKMSQRDVISWNTIITGCSQNGQPDEALKYFRQMQLTMKPNPVTIACVLPACASLAALQQGKEIHGHLARNGLFSDVFVGNALIDMYAKCGSIKDARQLFDNLSQRDSVSWTIMIAGYGMHGYGQDALLLFDQMQQAGFMPDHFTFIAVLCACSHAGLVDEGWQFFNLMSRECHITPKLEHYACMVDLLGRAGCLDEAYDFVNEMPLEPDAGVWGALLNACRIHRNIELGKCVADRVLDLEPENAGYYVLLSNIYAEAGRWDAVAKVRKKMNARGLKKNPGCSWVVVRNRVHAFLVGDRSHPQAEKIYAMLESLAGRMKEEGYVPDTNFVLREVEDEVKGHILCGHSEKLAIAFALISTGPGTPIRITKNLRVCGDCHSATKIISKIVRREITLRDASRFHHFKDGHCSCRDYW